MSLLVVLPVSLESPALMEAWSYRLRENLCQLRPYSPGAMLVSNARWSSTRIAQACVETPGADISEEWQILKKYIGISRVLFDLRPLNGLVSLTACRLFHRAVATGVFSGCCALVKAPEGGSTLQEVQDVERTFRTLSRGFLPGIYQDISMFSKYGAGRLRLVNL